MGYLILYVIIVVLLAIKIVVLFLDSRKEKKKKKTVIALTVAETFLVSIGIWGLCVVMLANRYTEVNGASYNAYLTPEVKEPAEGENGTTEIIDPKDKEGYHTVQIADRILKALDMDMKYGLIISDVSWEEARQECEKMGGHLADINSLAEQIKIEKYLRTCEYKNDNGPVKIWIGGYDLAIGEYSWITGSGGIFTDPNGEVYSNWAEGEPSRRDEQSDILENYVYMYYDSKSDSFLWNDAPVDISFWYGNRRNIGYLCEWD